MGGRENAGTPADAEGDQPSTLASDSIISRDTSNNRSLLGGVQEGSSKSESTSGNNAANGADMNMLSGLTEDEKFTYEARQAADEAIREMNDLVLGDWLLDETNNEVTFSDKVTIECFPGDANFGDYFLTAADDCNVELLVVPLKHYYKCRQELRKVNGLDKEVAVAKRDDKGAAELAQMHKDEAAAAAADEQQGVDKRATEQQTPAPDASPANVHTHTDAELLAEKNEMMKKAGAPAKPPKILNKILDNTANVSAVMDVVSDGAISRKINAIDKANSVSGER